MNTSQNRNTFQNLNGNPYTLARLQAVLREGALPHACIFAGSKDAQTREAALRFVQSVFCQSPQEGLACGTCLACRKVEHGNHEDLIFVEKEGAGIGVAAIRMLQLRLRNRSFSGRTAVIIQDADHMTVQSQNKLLKTLEDPGRGNLLILLSENPENLLRTIRSRCILYRLDAAEQKRERLKTDHEQRPPQPADEQQEKAEQLAGRLLQELMDAAPWYRLGPLVDAEVEDRDSALLLLDALEKQIRGRMLRPYLAEQSCPAGENLQPADEKQLAGDAQLRWIPSLETAVQHIRRGLNPKYSIKSMLLEMLDPASAG